MIGRGMDPICSKCAATRRAREKDCDDTRPIADGEVCIDCGDQIHARRGDETDDEFRARLMARLKPTGADHGDE